MAGKESVEDLGKEKARLELEREVARLRAEVSAYSVPWWRRATVVTGMATLLGAAIPAAAAVHGKLQTDKELALKSLEQEHAAALASLRFAEDVRARYLDRMKDEAERQRTLRFLIATATDEGIRKWASQEMVLVDNEVEQVKARILELEKQKAQADADYRDALSKKQTEAASLADQVQSIAREKARLEGQLKSPSSGGDADIGPRRSPSKELCLKGCMADILARLTPAHPDALRRQDECRKTCGD